MTLPIALLLALLPACASGDGADPGGAPAGGQPPGTASVGEPGRGPPGTPEAPVQLPTWGRELLTALEALDRHVQAPAPAHLHAARSALERGLRRRPALTFERLLLARVLREQGEDADAALAAVEPDRRVLYTLLLDRPLAELVPVFRALRHRACAAGGRPDCGPAPPYPADLAVWEQVAAISHAADRLSHWTGGRSRPDLPTFLTRIGVQEGMDVADIGAGEGWFSVPLARRVGSGTVWAVELDPALVAHQERVAAALGLATLRPVLGRPDDAGLAPGSVDLVFVCEVYKAVSDHRRAADPAHFDATCGRSWRACGGRCGPGGAWWSSTTTSPPRTPPPPASSWCARRWRPSASASSSASTTTPRCSSWGCGRRGGSGRHRRPPPEPRLPVEAFESWLAVWRLPG